MRFDRVATLITCDIEEPIPSEETQPVEKSITEEIVVPVMPIQASFISGSHIFHADAIISVLGDTGPVFSIPRVTNTRVFISNDFVEATRLPDAIRQLRAEVVSENTKRNVRSLIFELIVVSAILVYAYQCQILWRLFAVVGFVLFVVCAIILFMLSSMSSMSSMNF